MATHSTISSTPRSMQGESSGRKLPGRVVLLALVAFAIVFLDFESSSLETYGTALDATSHMGTNQVAVASRDQRTTFQSHADQELGRMQQHQLEQQWLDYKHYTEQLNRSRSITEPEVIVVESEQSFAHGGKSLYSNDSTLESTHSNSTSTQVQNALEPIPTDLSVEEIVTIESSNATDWDNHSVPNLSFNVSQNQKLGDSPSALVGEIISLDNSSQCFPYNSPRWRTGHLLTNADHNLTDDWIYKQIINSNILDSLQFSFVSSQTVCHDASQFRNPSRTEWDVTNHKLIEEWEFRLLYTAIHLHQHRLAAPEALARKSCPDKEALRNRNISRIDFECPSAQFLVSAIASLKVGESIRVGAVNALLLGLATNRIVVFANNVRGAHPSLEQPTLHANCPRGDFQCNFLPITPCSVLHEDLRNANELSDVDMLDLQLHGRMENADNRQAKILVLNTTQRALDGTKMKAMIHNRLYSIAVKLIDEIRQSASPEQVVILEAAAARIKWDNTTRLIAKNRTNDLEFAYDNRYSRAAHAALLYLVRPSPKYQQKSDDIVANTLPKDFDPIQSMGLVMPAHVSENCTFNDGNDDMCPGLDSYLSLASRLASESTFFPLHSGHRIDVLLSLDGKFSRGQLLNAQRNLYKVTNGSLPFRLIVPYRNATIERRLFQENEIKALALNHTSSPGQDQDENGWGVVLQSIVSIKIQLESASIVIGSCCSHDHDVILDLFQEGCGRVMSWNTTKSLKQSSDESMTAKTSRVQTHFCWEELVLNGSHHSCCPASTTVSNAAAEHCDKGDAQSLASVKQQHVNADKLHANS